MNDKLIIAGREFDSRLIIGTGKYRDNDEMAAQLAYWQEQLRDPLPALELPTDYPRGAALSFRTARQTLVLPGKLSDALGVLSRSRA